MPRALTSPAVRFTAYGLLAILTACSPRNKSGPETASATVTDSAGATPEKGAIALTTSSDEARQLYLQGRKLAEELRAHDGRKLFEQAAAKDPSFAMVHYQLAINSATAKDFFQHMNQAVALSDKASEGERLTILIGQAGANAQPRKALELAQELVSKYPDDERAHFLLGNSYFGQQEYEKAVGEYQKSIAINPEFSGAYNSLGYAYRPMKKYDEAEKAFKKYIELIPNDPNPYDSYAELLMKTGRFDESIAQYKKALSLDPHFSNSFIGIATNLMLQGKHTEAAAQAQKLYTAARDDGEHLAGLRLAAKRYGAERIDLKISAQSAARRGVDQDCAPGDLRMRLETRCKIHGVADASVGGAFIGARVACHHLARRNANADANLRFAGS